MNNRKNQRGFTLGEVLGAIIIGSIIFGAVALVISNAIETSRVSNQQENLSYLRMNIHEVYSHVHSFASISNDELLAANAVPQGMVVNDSIVNRWHGDVTLASANDGRAFTIQLDDIPESACIKLGAQRNMWDSLSINGTDIERETVVTTEHCTDEDSNTLTFQAH